MTVPLRVCSIMSPGENRRSELPAPAPGWAASDQAFCSGGTGSGGKHTPFSSRLIGQQVSKPYGRREMGHGLRVRPKTDQTTQP